MGTVKYSGDPQPCQVCGEATDYSGEFYDEYGYPKYGKPIHQVCDFKRQIKQLEDKIEAMSGALDRLTMLKRNEILKKRTYKQTGVCLTDGDGNMCLVDQSRVRWLDYEESVKLFNWVYEKE